MKNILLVGASSKSCLSFINKYKHLYNFVRLSRDADHSDVNNFELLNIDSYYNEDVKFDGIVYFPGNINLKPFEKLEIKDFEQDFKINFLGLVSILKFYKSRLNLGASLVFISTVATKIGMPFHSSVSAVKSSINGLTISLSAEWSPDIRVNCISPSLFESKMSEKFYKSERMTERMNERHPLKRTGNVNDISSLINFLISDESSWITGQIICVDGGLSSIKL